jgi:uncharacterized protein YcbX
LAKPIKISVISENSWQNKNDNMNNLILSEIWIYPIKSLGGILLQKSRVEKRGLQYDRRWMLVDEKGQFLTQRKFPKMALLQVELLENGLKVYYKKDESQFVIIPFESEPLKALQVQVWDDECAAYSISESINNWFSEMLEMNCQLVYMPDNSKRLLDERYAKSETDINSFSDAYPILILGQRALDFLNEKLESPIPMNRFRPNLVFTGGSPNEEDSWKIFSIGVSEFFGVKPCARCVMTTINQASSEKGKEPLKTLATYRKVGQKILFGQCLIPKNTGQIIEIGNKILLDNNSSI